jgi:hypothetical protein
MAAALERLRIDGHVVQESDVSHLSPWRYEHINPYGKYAFESTIRLAVRTRLTDPALKRAIDRLAPRLGLTDADDEESADA